MRFYFTCGHGIIENPHKSSPKQEDPNLIRIKVDYRWYKTQGKKKKEINLDGRNHMSFFRVNYRSKH